MNFWNIVDFAFQKKHEMPFSLKKHAFRIVWVFDFQSGCLLSTWKIMNERMKWSLSFFQISE